MENQNLNYFREKMNLMAGRDEPFLFIINYNLSSTILIPAGECQSQDVYYQVDGISNCIQPEIPKEVILKKYPLPYSEYLKSFNIVQDEIHMGNSYLVNLTFSTPVEVNLSLSEIFYSSKARFKLLFKDQFLVFSPERFVKISRGKISTYPMKGTIDASIENAEELLLKNEKETAEHATIVDLMRNDLSLVATNVRVENYRYIERINTSGKNLLQMSSLISGDLSPGYKEKLGDIMISLLPAGSITGAPKKATLEIIEAAEKHNRGFYTGVFGFFDGETLSSGVMIRFIENQDGKMIYKSGGGITALSKPDEEYQELIDKIYVPFN